MHDRFGYTYIISIYYKKGVCIIQTCFFQHLLPTSTPIIDQQQSTNNTRKHTNHLSQQSQQLVALLTISNRHCFPQQSTQSPLASITVACSACCHLLLWSSLLIKIATKKLEYSAVFLSSCNIFPEIKGWLLFPFVSYICTISFLTFQV